MQGKYPASGVYAIGEVLLKSFNSRVTKDYLHGPIERAEASCTLIERRNIMRFSETQLTLPEASCVVDALNGIRFTEGITAKSHLYSNVRDAIEMDRLDTKWEVSVNELLDQIGMLTEEEALEVIAKVRDFWDASPHDDIEFGLRQAGLIPPIDGWTMSSPSTLSDSHIYR